MCLGLNIYEPILKLSFPLENQKKVFNLEM